MADLTYDANIRIRGQEHIEKWLIDTAAARTFYKGQPVMIDQDVDTVNVVQFVTAVVVDPADVILGIAAEGKSVLIAAAETTEINVWVWPTVVGFKSTVFTNADLGKLVYMSDSATLSTTAADNPLLGTLDKVQDGYCFVRLSAPIIPTGA